MQTLKMHNPVNWIACIPCKPKFCNTETVKAIYLKTTNTILNFGLNGPILRRIQELPTLI